MCATRLTHWGRGTHTCVIKLIITGSDNGLSPGRHQAIIQTNAERLLIGPLWTNFSEILIKIQNFSFMKMHLKMSSWKWQPSCLGLNILRQVWNDHHLYWCGVSPLQTYECIQDRTQGWGWGCYKIGYLYGLAQERLNSSALAMELRLSCTNPSICVKHILNSNLGKSHLSLTCASAMELCLSCSNPLNSVWNTS